MRKKPDGNRAQVIAEGQEVTVIATKSPHPHASKDSPHTQMGPIDHYVKIESQTGSYGQGYVDISEALYVAHTRRSRGIRSLVRMR